MNAITDNFPVESKMKASITVLVLLGITCIGAFPSHDDIFERQASEDTVDLFKREYSGQAARPCIRLSGDVSAMIDHVDDNILSFDLKRIVQFFTQIDVRNITALNEIVCHFVDDSTDAFMTYLRDSGIERSIVRRVYAFSVINLSMAAYMVDPRGVIHNNFVVTGYAHLDPVGVAELIATIRETSFVTLRHEPDLSDLAMPERPYPLLCEDFDLFTDKSKLLMSMSPFYLL
ncbi:hypothetical protein CAPTEDRAFT_228647 [Capitella teleta]|uniref:Uncharacterized protein n=1 Tax=Capitella teleta TaxID=283909 RepID=R7TM74_CAPTE|nr:hypothetical protein CAPTEDRAFT_228647 [Capitella teleta]|eukprot:ELT94933.1 hypothetical protein CAPTEDRAFT_228647 [Capitella teleta]